MQQANLHQQLLTNVLEVRFVRRTQKQTAPPTRRMWCTNSVDILNSINGKIILGYQAPTSSPKYDPALNDIVITWDILMQDFRCIPANACTVLQTIPATEEFWKFFNENIYTMSTQQKLDFMNT
jgi:hypothetical protein